MKVYEEYVHVKIPKLDKLMQISFLWDNEFTM